jgi:hypothetical protein
LREEGQDCSQSLKPDKKRLISRQLTTVALMQLCQTVYAPCGDEKDCQGEEPKEDLQAEM